MGCVRTYGASMSSNTGSHATASSQDELLHAQWSALRAWMGGEQVLAHLDSMSTLDGWTVRDLMAHMGRCFVSVDTTVTVEDQQPQTLGAYLSQYGPAADEIAEGTRRLSDEVSDALLPSLDAFAAHGFASLARLRGPVVRGPRGPIAREDFVVTRMLELVVHSDDLSRSVPTVEPVPLVQDCVDIVSRSLAGISAERTGTVPQDCTGIAWIRRACGREHSDDPNLPLL